MPFVHPLLAVATPGRWVGRAIQCRDVLLIDHANCEKKAASTALALMFAYADSAVTRGSRATSGRVSAFATIVACAA